MSVSASSLWWSLWSYISRCSVKENDLDICIGNPDIVFFMGKDFGFQMFFRWRKVTLALPILALTCASVLQSHPMCQRRCPGMWSVRPLLSFPLPVRVGLLTLRTLLFHPWIFSHRFTGFSATILVFSCICCWVWDRQYVNEIPTFNLTFLG